MPIGKRGFQKGHKINKGQTRKATHTIEAAKAREMYINFVTANLKPLLEAQYDLAKGHWVERTDKNGHKRVYLTPPNNEAIKYMFDQSLGKAKEQVEHTGNITLIIDE
jgi:hypothetical protein